MISRAYSVCDFIISTLIVTNVISIDSFFLGFDHQCLKHWSTSWTVGFTPIMLLMNNLKIPLQHNTIFNESVHFCIMVDCHQLKRNDYVSCGCGVGRFWFCATWVCMVMSSGIKAWPNRQCDTCCYGTVCFVPGVPKIDFHMMLQHVLKLNVLNKLKFAKIWLTNSNHLINQLLIFMAKFWSC